jgi:D-alanyl-D-alanine carboxypeptidase/D-alanyl-D-alanine-endopeptidase (penicillin-binding protein 4)
MLKNLLLFFWAPVLCHAQLSTFSETWKNDKDLKNASIGFCVLDARTSSVIAEYNPQLGLIPASTLKVVTTSAALGLLGSDFRYQTKLYYTGTLNSKTGELNGNLVITGSGDPTLQSENFAKDSLRITDKWAQVLWDKGIRKISGAIIGDASCFERAIPDNWVWSDIGNYFGTAPCGLSYSDNKFKIIYNSHAAGSPAEVKDIRPNYQGVSIEVVSTVTASGSEDEAFVYGDPFSYRREVKGRIPPNKSNYEVEAALPDPALLCAQQLVAALLKRGIACSTGAPLSNYEKADTLVDKQLLYTHFSPTLDKIILYTNLKSNNLYAESLLRTMGKGRVATGIEAVKNYWQQRGLDVSELFMSDGSGLSRSNTTTTGFQARLLSKVYRDSLNYKLFNASLPVAGKSGSMSSIGKGTPIENNLRAKTGYIQRARGYCGYVKTRSGQELAFSLLFNNYNCSAKDAKLKLEKFMVALWEL